MVNNKNIYKLKTIPISEVKIGSHVINLGPILEIDRLESHYNLIISRLNEKQVIRFEKETTLVIF